MRDASFAYIGSISSADPSLLHGYGRNHVRNLGIPRASPKKSCYDTMSRTITTFSVDQWIVKTKKRKTQVIIDSNVVR